MGEEAGAIGPEMMTCMGLPDKRNLPMRQKEKWFVKMESVGSERYGQTET